MHFCVYRPLTVQESQRLFASTCLSSSHQKDLEEEEFSISPFIAIDYLIGLMRLPYLYVEVREVSQAIQKRGEWWSNSELLALVANSAEVLIWAGKKHFIILGQRSNFLLQGICYISRIILYERAVYQESGMMMQIGREKKEGSSYQKLKCQLISHTTYLGWVTLALVTHVTGGELPKQYMNYLHLVSVLFGAIATGYDPMPKGMSRCLAPIMPQKISA